VAVPECNVATNYELANVNNDVDHSVANNIKVVSILLKPYAQRDMLV